MIQMHNYSATTNTAAKKQNWDILNTKVLNKLKCVVGAPEVERIIMRENSTQLLVEVLRDIRMKMKAYAPIYASTANGNLSEQKKRDEARSNGPYKDRSNGGKTLGDTGLSVSAIVKSDTRRSTRLLSTESNTSEAGATSVSSTLSRSAVGISPPGKMKRPSATDTSRRPSRIAAGIAGNLMGLGEGEELMLGTAGRAVGQKQRMKQREDQAALLRKKNTAKRLSAVEMDTMFEALTDNMNKELQVHSEQLDRLDVKSKQFDAHMKELREANRKAMEVTDKNLAKAMRNDDAGKIEPGFAMGRPEFIKAPSMEMGSSMNGSFVGLVSPHSNTLEEIGDEFEGSLEPYQAEHSSPPPPPSHPPPPHVLASHGKGSICSYIHGIGREMDSEETSEEKVKRTLMNSMSMDSIGEARDDDESDCGGLDMSQSDADAAAALFSKQLNFDVSAVEDSYDSGAPNGGATPMGRPSSGTASARKVRLSLSGPSTNNCEQEEAREEPAPPPLPPSTTGVDWCELMHAEHKQHYYMHHSGISQWEKPTVGVVQCTDAGSGKIYYVDMSTGESSWTAPAVKGQ
jgi:hypothetical protein